MTRILTRREKTLFYFTAAVLIFAICFSLLNETILKEAWRLNKEINISEAKLKKYARLLSRKTYIENKYNKLSLGFKPEEAGDVLVSVLFELEGLAAQAGIRIVDIRPQAQAIGASANKEALVNLRVEGSMEQYLRFIYTIENSLSLLRIRKFQLISSPNTSILEGSFSIFQLSLTD